MAKVLKGELYLTPNEASARLQISYKTLQRWAEVGGFDVWTTKTNGKTKRVHRRFHIEMIRTPTGYRYYSETSIKSLARPCAR